MQNRLILCALMALMLLLTACARKYFPDMLLGTIKNGIYTTHIGKNFGRFYKPGCNLNVMIPQMYKNFDEEHFMPTMERYGNTFTFVAFGPVASNATTYRVLAVEKCAMPLETFKNLYFPKMIALGAKADNRQMFRIHHEYLKVDNRPAYYEVYTQRIPGQYLYYSPRQTGDITLTHAFYYVDYGKYGVILWIQASTDSAMWPINHKNRYQMIQRTWRPQIWFVRSFFLS